MDPAACKTLRVNANGAELGNPQKRPGKADEEMGMGAIHWDGMGRDGSDWRWRDSLGIASDDMARPQKESEGKSEGKPRAGWREGDETERKEKKRKEKGASQVSLRAFWPQSI